MQVCLSGAFRYGQQLSAVERVFTAHNLLVAASENPLRATTINDCAKLGPGLGGTPTIVERLPRPEVDAMGRRLRSPRLPGVDVPGVDGDGPASTSPAWARRLRPGPAGPMAERWLSLSWWWACESRLGRSRRGSGRCSGLSVVRGRLRGLSWGNRPHFGADQPRRPQPRRSMRSLDAMGRRLRLHAGRRCCPPESLPSGAARAGPAPSARQALWAATRRRLTHGPRSGSDG